MWVVRECSAVTCIDAPLVRSWWPRCLRVALSGGAAPSQSEGREIGRHPLTRCGTTDDAAGPWRQSVVERFPHSSKLLNPLERRDGRVV